MRRAVEITNLNHQYSDGTVSLENVSLAIDEGEMIAVIGQNGAGKTTLFLHLNGSIRSFDDNVFIFGQNIGTMSIEERICHVGVVFQDPDDQLFMPTVYDDVAFGPTNMGLPEDEVERRVKEALSTVGLSGFEDRVPHHMSYGQKKRAALAAVLSMEPRILVFDEPTANLDPKSRAVFIRLINDLNKNKGITTIVAMHDVNAVPDVADRVVILNRTIVADGTPVEVFSDISLLEDNNLDVPEIYKMFCILGCYGCTYEVPPLTIPEAALTLDRMIDTNGGTVRLGRSENTKEEMTDLFRRFCR
ncbi:energy-coupling factor ABC transporter ATP-binding protein [Methanogenium sp. MK-MG]|uniref:energy-coupling factor ABC transporter ATP-binding protein n=1 Tax=Methanogenium sp. MK-MG TaxID=2599926 RepID=UPI0013EE135C|nr:ATP-binding cassette domain-containing protein [Methanogenium sp. MK-MG]KAF1076393.1 Vitamin B12 import ATP-binding protein BtuD [Methanogenium sp. MK-MG]